MCAPHSPFLVSSRDDNLAIQPDEPCPCPGRALSDQVPSPRAARLTDMVCSCRGTSVVGDNERGTGLSGRPAYSWRQCPTGRTSDGKKPRASEPRQGASLGNGPVTGSTWLPAPRVSEQVPFDFLCRERSATGQRCRRFSVCINLTLRRRECRKCPHPDELHPREATDLRPGRGKNWDPWEAFVGRCRRAAAGDRNFRRTFCRQGSAAG